MFTGLGQAATCACAPGQSFKECDCAQPLDPNPIPQPGPSPTGDYLTSLTQTRTRAKPGWLYSGFPAITPVQPAPVIVSQGQAQAQGNPWPWIIGGLILLAVTSK